jgi:hypothetical protein
MEEAARRLRDERLNPLVARGEARRVEYTTRLADGWKAQQAMDARVDQQKASLRLAADEVGAARVSVSRSLSISLDLSRSLSISLDLCRSVSRDPRRESHWLGSRAVPV